MTNVPLSPAIVTNITQNVLYRKNRGAVTPCFVGGATKGPLDELVYATSALDLVRKLGQPVATDYGLLTAVAFFENGGQSCYYMRVADSNAAAAQKLLTGAVGGSAAVAAQGTVRFDANMRDADTVTVSDGTTSVVFEFDKLTAAQVIVTLTGQPVDTDNLTFIDASAVSKIYEFDSNAAITGDYTVTIGASLAATVQNLTDAINVSGDDYTAVADTVNMTVTITQGTAGTAGNTAVAQTDAGGVIASAGLYGTADAFDAGANTGVSGANVAITGGASAILTASSFVDVVNAHAFGVTATLTNTGSGATAPLVTLTNDAGGVAGNVTITSTAGARLVLVGMAGGAAAVSGTVMTVLQVDALNTGTWGNNVQVKVAQPSSVPGASLTSFDLTVLAPTDVAGTQQVVEIFRNCEMAVAAERYIATVVNQGLRNSINKSLYITVTAVRNDTAPTAVSVAAPLLGGADGISALVAADYVGTINGNLATGLQVLRDPEDIRFELLVVPGQTNIDIINEAITVADLRQDCIALLDSPAGLSAQQVTDWHNGTSALVSNAPASPLDNWRGALFWDWFEDYSSYLKQDVAIPVTGYVAAAISKTADKVGAWIPTAGTLHGILSTKARITHSPRRDERDIMLGNGSKVNPVVKRAEGLVLSGNATLQRAEGPLDALHVALLTITLNARLRDAIASLQYAPNNPRIRAQVTDRCMSVLQSVQSADGLEWFEVVCDVDNNPLELRAKKTMQIDILLKHIDAAESILLNIALNPSATESTLA